MSDTDITDSQKQFMDSFINAFNPGQTCYLNGTNSNDEILSHFRGERRLSIKPVTNNHAYLCSIRIHGDDAQQQLKNLCAVCEVQELKCYVIAKAENDFSVQIFFFEPIPVHMVFRLQENLLIEAQIIDEEESLEGHTQPFCLIERPFELPFNGADWSDNNGIFLDPETGFESPYQDQAAVLKNIEKHSLSDVARVINDLNTSPTPPKGDQLKQDFIEYNLSNFVNTILGKDALVEITPDLVNADFFHVNPMLPLCDHIRKLNKAGQDCFFGVAPRNKNIGKRSTLMNISNIKTVFIDIDPPDKTKSAEEQSADAKELLNQFSAKLQEYGIAMSSFVVASGHGYHIYFVLQETIPLPSPEWQVVQNALIEVAGGDSAAKDITRVLRLPFSQNNKDPNNPQPVKIVDNTGNLFTLDNFDSLVKDYSSRHKIAEVHLEDSNIKDLPPCLDKLFDSQTTVPKGYRHKVRFVCSIFAHKQGWAEADTIQRLEHTTSDKLKCKSDVEGVYKILNAAPNRYHVGCGNGSLLRELVNDGITICDQANCPYYTQQKGGVFKNPIRIMSNKYCKEKQVDKKTVYEPISTFRIEATESIICDNKEYINAKLISECGREVSLVIPPETWLSKQRFLSILPGKEFIFLGTETDVHCIHHLISKEEFPTKQGFKTIGLHLINGLWTYLTNTGALTMNGRSSDAVYIGDVTEYNTDILETEPMAPESLAACLKSFAYFNHPYVSAPVIGFTVACFFKPRLFMIKNSFPILFVSGERGSAKTATIRAIVLSLHGTQNAEKMLAQMTSFTVMKLVNASNCMPIFFDEYKPSILKEEKVNMISELFRTAYNGLSGDRGQADQSKIRYKYDAPVIIAGEDQSTEPAVMERMIAVSTSKTESGKYQQYFEYLVNNFDLKALGRLIVEKAVTMTDEEVVSIYQFEHQQIQPVFTGRLRDNVAIARFGLHILNKIFLEKIGQPFPITPFHAEESQRINLIEEQEAQRSVVDNITEVFVALIYESESNDKLNNNYKLVSETHYYVKGNELRINLSSFYQILKKWCKDYHFDGEILSKPALLKQIRSQPYFIHYKKAQIMPKKPGGPLCLILGLSELRASNIEIYDICEGSAAKKQQQNMQQINTP
ncbi:hypothetical protein MTBBW1_1980005 [Desulfamplus magnetovallimortis]|uniref:TOTE conflict system primase domain-containing protein n=1 Tax=Desulfamplus magnetovallimortis TaxID=1246637 RepID=A0A1W1HBG3_9BACT|nr:hypothetical protein [Desulfamplus magnetovallimortis]SLM29783.1 hypothetical protein MTBBW1_1980005 [Desulfamplus magnetovallimortis]